MARSDLDLVTEAFVRGFCVTRSVAHPCVFEQTEGVWVARDASRRNPRTYRREEWIACGVAPAIVHRVASANTRGRYVICAMLEAGESDTDLRAQYKALGYRLGATEPVMIHRLKRIPVFSAPVLIERVRTREQAIDFGRAWKMRPMDDQMLADDAPLRQYMALDGQKVVGGARSVRAGDATMVSAMFVSPSHRRRGIGKALLARLLRDDRKHGSAMSMLTASHAGAMLYPQVGFEQVGVLYAFTPRR